MMAKRPAFMTINRRVPVRVQREGSSLLPGPPPYSFYPQEVGEPISGLGKGRRRHDIDR